MHGGGGCGHAARRGKRADMSSDMMNMTTHRLVEAACRVRAIIGNIDRLDPATKAKRLRAALDETASILDEISFKPSRRPRFSWLRARLPWMRRGVAAYLRTPDGAAVTLALSGREWTVTTERTFTVEADALAAFQDAAKTEHHGASSAA